MKSGVVGFVKT